MEPQKLDLRDIHLPEVIDWWPPAIGWFLLPLLILVLCVFTVWLYRYITNKTALKTAKKQLLEIQQDSSSKDIQKLTHLSELLRRVAISISPRSECASLTGQAWLEHLDSSVKGTPFTKGIGQHLASTHYKKSVDTDIDISQIATLCESWLKAQKHKR